MATAETPLSFQSTPIQEHEKQPVHPKSYAAVVEEELPVHEQDGVGEVDGTNGTMSTNGMNGTASVLRIVDTNASAERKAVVVEESAQSDRTGPNKGHIQDVRVPTLSFDLQCLTSVGT
jgi:hypothetical protein